jgi:hypothetical protein
VRCQHKLILYIPLIIFVFPLSLFSQYIIHVFALTGPNFLAYENPTLGVKIQYPATWIESQNGLKDFSDVVGFYAPFGNLSDISTGTLIVSIRHYLHDITLDGYNSLINNLLKQPNVQAIQSNPFTLAERPAHKVVFLASPPGLLKMETMLVWTVKGNDVYIISFNSEPSKYPTYAPIVDKMIDTFEITNSTGTK